MFEELPMCEQQVVEVLNYLFPIGLIIGLGAWRALRRGKVAPVVSLGGRSAGTKEVA